MAVLEGDGLFANPFHPQLSMEGSLLEGLPGARCAHRAVWVSEWNMLPNIS